MEYDAKEVLEVLQNAERLGVPITSIHDLAAAMLLRTLYNGLPEYRRIVDEMATVSSDGERGD